jgi:hypothetical protein
VLLPCVSAVKDAVKEIKGAKRKAAKKNFLLRVPGEAISFSSMIQGFLLSLLFACVSNELILPGLLYMCGCRCCFPAFQL